jgi:ABC-type uncharacterized transport system involved in gliding motility auxiliary subunit
MTARRYALLAALALFIMFIAANVTGTTWFRSWRLDLTENQLYSISRGTRGLCRSRARDAANIRGAQPRPRALRSG